MPALPNVSHVVRLDLLQTVGPNTRVRNRLFFQYTGAGPSAADMTTLLNTASSQWNTNMVPVLNPISTLTTIAGTDLTSNTGAQTQITVSRVGTRVGNPLPAGTAMVIRFKVPRRYRGGHPRFYVGGLAQDQISTAVAWTSSALSAVTTAVQNFIAGVIAAPPASFGTLSHANVSFFLGFHNVTFPSGRIRPVPTLRSSPVVDLVQSYSGNPNIASQRRRNLQSA